MLGAHKSVVWHVTWIHASQLIGVYTHVPLTQLSAVQVSLSSHIIILLEHPVNGKQESTVHASLSSQDILLLTHPVAGLQESEVHKLESSPRYTIRIK